MSSSFVVKGVIANRDLEELLKYQDLWARLANLADFACTTVEELADQVADLEGWDDAERLPRKVKVEVTIDE